MKHILYLVAIAGLLGWVYDLRREQVADRESSEFWYQSMRSAERRINDHRRELYQIRTSCGRDI